MKKITRNQAGFSMVEVLVSLAIMGAFGAALLGGLATTARTTPLTDEKSTAQNLAETQMEYVRTLAYQYDVEIPLEYGLKPDMDVPDGYNVDTEAYRLDADGDGTDDDDGLQRIEITVTNRDKTVTILEGYRIRQ